MTSTNPRDARLRRLYNVTEAEWEAVLAAQGGGCAICGRKGATRSLHTDHNHADGEFRGILCARHNIALREGMTAEFLRKMADYLDDPPARRFFGEPRFGMPGRTSKKRRRKSRRKRKVTK
jgi:hypothetical protein